MTRRLLVLAALILPFLACAKKTDYLYYYNDNKQVVFEHKIKELQGNANLDILWVIDNSDSMSAHQRTVINNMNSFVDGLVLNKSLRWRMGLISTTDREAPYVGLKSGDLLDYSMPNAAQRFKSAVARLGLLGSATEKEYDPIISHLKSYPDFVRPDAFLAIITVSDAPDQSGRSTQNFISEMTSIKGKISNVLFYSFSNPLDWCSPTDTAFNWTGSKHEELLKTVQGGAFPLCDPNFGQKIANLGSNIASQVTSPRIELKDRPILTTLKVLHKGVEVPAGPPENGGYWVYDVRSNSIVFNDMTFAPNDNESVRVVYEVDQN